MASLQGGSAGKALAPRPGRWANPRWSAKGLCCGGWPVGVGGKPRQRRAKPTGSLCSSLQPAGGFVGFVITTFRLARFLGPESLTPHVVSSHPQPFLLGRPRRGTGSNGRSGRGGLPARRGAANHVGSVHSPWPPGSSRVTYCSALCVLPHPPPLDGTSAPHGDIIHSQPCKRPPAPTFQGHERGWHQPQTTDCTPANGPVPQSPREAPKTGPAAGHRQGPSGSSYG